MYKKVVILLVSVILFIIYPYCHIIYADSDTASANYSFNFENGPGEWKENGAVRLIRTYEYVNSGRYSIYIDDRKNSSDGILLNAEFLPKQTDITFSAFVLYSINESSENHDFKFSIQYISAGALISHELSAVTVIPDTWTELKGRFTIPGDAQHIQLLINTCPDKKLTVSPDTLPFYIDNVSIRRTSDLLNDTSDNQDEKHDEKTVSPVLVISISATFIVIIAVALLIKKRKKHSDKPQFTVFDADELKQEIEILSQKPDMCKDINIVVCSINFTEETLKYKDEAVERCATIVLRAAGKAGSVYRTNNNEFVCMSVKPIKEQLEKEIKYETSKPCNYPFSISTGFANGDERNFDIAELISTALSEVVTNENMTKLPH